MLHEVTPDGKLVWTCPGDEEEECGIVLSAYLDEASYHEEKHSKKPGRGAVIALPACACGVQTFLKADYTVKELYKALICYEEGGRSAYVLPLRYIHNLRVHWMLYQRGKAAYAPVLDMPPQALLDDPMFAGVQPSTVYALWFGFATMKQHAPQAIEARKVYLLETKQ